MKKFLVCLVSIILILFLIGCGKTTSESGGGGGSVYSTHSSNSHSPSREVCAGQNSLLKKSTIVTIHVRNVGCILHSYDRLVLQV